MKRGVIMLALMGLGASGIASADTVVKVGFAGPLTGPVAHIGKDEQYGAQLALDDANAKGVTLAGQKVPGAEVPEGVQVWYPTYHWPSAPT